LFPQKEVFFGRTKLLNEKKIDDELVLKSYVPRSTHSCAERFYIFDKGERLDRFGRPSTLTSKSASASAQKLNYLSSRVESRPCFLEETKLFSGSKNPRQKL